MEHYQIKNSYTTMYLGLLHKYDLTPAEELLLCIIYGLSKKEGWCYASKETLAMMLNVSTPTIYNLIRKLRRKGLIIKLGISQTGTMKLQVVEEIENFIYEVHKELTKDKEGYV